jgi:hypothetical protein
MSVGSLNIVPVKDPRLNYNEAEQRQIGILLGPSQSTYRQVVSTNFSNQQITVNVIPSSPSDFVSRRIMIRTTYRCTFVGTSAGVGIPLLQMPGARAAPGVPLGNIGYAAPRCFPFTTSCNTVSISFNGTTITTQLNSYSDQFQRFNRTAESEDRYYSLTTSQPDFCNAYNDLLGTNLSPFVPYGTNVLQESRGAYPELLVLRNDATGAPGDTTILEFTVTEPIFISPLVTDGWEDHLDLTGLQNLDIVFSIGGRGNGPFSGLIASVFSIDPLSGSTFTAMSADVLACEAQLTYISPSLIDEVPRDLLYQYHMPVFYPQGAQPPCLPGQVITLTQNSVQLQSIPTRMYAWVGLRRQDMTVFEPNFNFAVNQIQVTFQNAVQLNGATRQDIYNMAQKNGCNLSYRQYFYDCGSVVCLDFGTDLALRSGQSPGMTGSYEFQLQYTCVNQTGRTITPILNVLFMLEGVMTKQGSIFNTQIGIIGERDVLEAYAKPAQNVYKRSTSLYGSGFWDSFKSFAKKLVRPLISAAAPFAAANPLASAALGVADQVAKSYGMGMPQGISGRGLVGGAPLSAKQLKNMR